MKKKVFITVLVVSLALFTLISFAYPSSDSKKVICNDGTEWYVLGNVTGSNLSYSANTSVTIPNGKTAFVSASFWGVDINGTTYSDFKQTPLGPSAYASRMFNTYASHITGYHNGNCNDCHHGATFDTEKYY